MRSRPTPSIICGLLASGRVPPTHRNPPGATDELLRRPIIILGAPRSGTSILAETLAADPDLTYVGEPRLVWRYGNDRKSDMLREVDARDEVRAHIRAFFARDVTERGGRRLLEKTPHNSLRPGFVNQVFPDCLFVHVIRSGPDCISAIRRAWLDGRPELRLPHRRLWLRRRLQEAGWRRAPFYAAELLQRMTPSSLSTGSGQRPWGPRLPGVDGLLRDLDLLDVCALMWRMCVEAASSYGRQLPADRYIECHLETLTVERLREVVAFCNLADAASVERRYESTFDTAKIVARGNDLDSDERARVLSWIGPTLAWIGDGAT